MTFQEALIYLRGISCFDELLEDDDGILSIDDIIIPIDCWVMSNDKENVSSLAIRILDFYLGDYCREYEHLRNEAECEEEYVDGEKFIHYDCLARRINHIGLLMLDLYDIFIAKGVSLSEVWERIGLPGTFKEASDELLFKELVDTIPESDNDKKYKTLPRTHRIAAIKELIRKSGLCRNIDDTKISAFVEAVTGGNIEAQAKNTQSYKTPTKEAQNAAAEWLRKIGIE